MTKEQLSQLPDDVRISAELVLEHLKTINFPPQTMAVNEDGGLAIFFQTDYDGLVVTADLEIDKNGEITASVIPYVTGPEGHSVLSDTERLKKHPIDLWDVNEPPPFEESFRHIRFRLGEAPEEGDRFDAAFSR